MKLANEVMGKFGLINFVVCAVALLAWGEYERGWMLTTALLSGGIGLVAGSFEIMLAQRGDRLLGVGRWYEQWGFALYPWAFVFLFTGLTVFAIGLVRFSGLGSSFEGYLQRRPGAALVVAGLVMAGSGTATVIGPRSWRASRWDLLLRLPARLFGLLLILMGITACILGLFELLSPSGFDLWLDNHLGPFNPLP